MYENISWNITCSSFTPLCGAWIMKIKYKKDVAGQIREYRLEDNGEFGANPKRLAVSTCVYKSESTTYYRYAVMAVVIVCVTGYK